MNERPRTYNGYNSEGAIVASYTGADATQRINPEEVKAKMDNVVQVAAEQIKKICSALENIRTDTDKAIIVQGTSMDPYLQAAKDAVEQLEAEIKKIINDGNLYQATIEVHDKLQDINNQEAYDKTCSCDGVSDVKEA